MFNEGFPSWLYCINLGATTIWERWNTVLEDGTISKMGMNSLNHHSYGTIVQFMYEYIGGIKPAEPGFKVANIAPVPSMRFRYFNSAITTAAGKYVSNWKIAEDGKLTVELEVPFNGAANVALPRFSRERLNITGGNVDITDDGKATLPAGHYEISYMPAQDFRNIYSPQTRLAELPYLFYLGGTPETVLPVTEQIIALKRW